MTVPQIQGWLKPIVVIFVGSLCMGILNAYSHGDLTGFDMLVHVAEDSSFGAFMAVIGWLGLRSPLSAAFQQETAADKDKPPQP